MKLLITGGAGFTGSAVIRYIVQDTDAHVVNVDKLTYAGNLESLSDVGADIRVMCLNARTFAMRSRWNEYSRTISPMR